MQFKIWRRNVPKLKKQSSFFVKRFFCAFKFGIYLILFLGLLNIPGLAQTDDVLAKQVDEMMQKAFPANEPGAAILVQKAGAIILRKGYGMADLELGVPMAPDMVFRLGSITKQFTAVAILMLAEQGKLSLQDEITRFLPDYPAQGKKVTVEHLLTHTSGIQSYTDLPEWLPLLRKDMTVGEIIDLFKNKAFLFEPGEKWVYNNSGYILLGAIIEKVSGQSYESFIQKNIFEPLGLTHSFYDSTERVIPRRIPGYSHDKSGYVNAPYLSMTQPYAAGSLLSTVDDLSVWNAALLANKLLKPETIQKAWAPYKLKNGDSSGYGYGWQVSTYEEHFFVEHGGGIPGFASYALSIPADGVYVAILVNCNAPNQTPGDLAFKIASMALGKPYQDPKLVAVKPEKLEKLVGVYRISDKEERIITRDGGRLFSQRTGGTKYEIFPLSDTQFFFKDSLNRITFLKDKKGEVKELIMKGRLGPAERAQKTAKPLPTEKKAIHLDPAILDRYAGEYELMPGFSIVVSLEGEHLMAQATGQPKLEIIPESETRFFLKEVDAQIEFQLDAAGKVTGLILHQGGQSLPAKKK